MSVTTIDYPVETVPTAEDSIEWTAQVISWFEPDPEIVDDEPVVEPESRSYGC